MGRAWVMRSAASMPSITGILISRMARSGCFSTASRTASSPRVASATTRCPSAGQLAAQAQQADAFVVGDQDPQGLGTS